MALCEDIKISNICSSFILNSRLCRETLKHDFPTINYPERFSGGILKYPEGCLLVFDSGKVNVTGVRNIATAYSLIDRFCSKYSKDLKHIECKIVNIVTYSRLKPDFDYKKLEQFPSYSYEPELFPGMHVKVDKSKVIFIVFRTGRIICTGLKKHEAIKSYYKKFEDELI